jgi:hypothetical protein
LKFGVGRLKQNPNSKVIILTCHYVHDLYSSNLDNMYFSFKQQIWKFGLDNQKWCVWYLTNKRPNRPLDMAKNSIITKLGLR